jgi:hypothetical protein
MVLDKDNNILCAISRWELNGNLYEAKIPNLTLGETYTLILFYEEIKNN